MRSHTQSVVIEPNRRRITGSISYKPLIRDIRVLIVCNKTGGTIKGDKNLYMGQGYEQLRLVAVGSCAIE